MPPPIGDSFVITAVDPGIFGDLIVIVCLGAEGGPNYAATLSGPTDTTITLTVGTTGGVTNLDWAAIAALFNADPTVNGLATMDGQPGDNTNPAAFNMDDGVAFTDGTDGGGAGQFYAAGVAPPSEIEVNIIFVGVVRFLVRDLAQDARQAFRRLASAALFAGSVLMERLARRLADAAAIGRPQIAGAAASQNFGIVPQKVALNRCNLRQLAQPVAQVLRETKDLSAFVTFRSPRLRFSGGFTFSRGEFAQPVAQDLLETRYLPVSFSFRSPAGKLTAQAGRV